jgi:hypothetical protein
MMAKALWVAVSLVAVLVSQAVAQEIKPLQDRWEKCLKSSFRVNRKQTPDPNLAAERALQACSTEEDELWAVSADAGVPRSAFAHLKSAMKQVLIEGK